MSEGHWVAWHGPYDDPSSNLSRRLAAVRAHVRTLLDQAAPGPVRILSVCAGQGQDVIGAAAAHRRARDVRARLVELDPVNARVAEEAAARAGLGGVEVCCTDASISDAYEGAVPAQLVLVCGVFGNISMADTARTIDLLPMLCSPGASVVWTRHRRPPDRTGEVRRLFARQFEERAFTAPDDAVFTVGAHVLTDEPSRFRHGERLFTFVGDGARPA